MSRALTRTNLILETGKVRRLRKSFGARSNSEAVRRAIDEALIAQQGLAELRALRHEGGLQDVFGRAPARKKK